MGIFGNLTGIHLIIILAVIVLLFGAPKLPGLARSVGQSMRIFKSEVKTMKDESADPVSGNVDANVESGPTTSEPARDTTAPETPPKP